MLRALPALLAIEPRRLAWLVASVMAGAYLALRWWQLRHGLGAEFHGQDSIAYWSLKLADPYRGQQIGSTAAFLYSPVIALLIFPLTVLPWPVFYMVWAGLSMTALAWMVGPVVAAVLLVTVRPVYAELWVGNIHLLIAAAIVVGMRWPAAWAFPLLTKVTPGIGLVWYLARREWRPLGVALGVTAGLVVITLLFMPAQWFEWIGVLTRSAATEQPREFLPLPRLVRFAVAAAMLGVAAHYGQRWVVPLGVMVALPASGIMALSLGVAAIALAPRRWWLIAVPLYVLGAAVWLALYEAR